MKKAKSIKLPCKTGRMILHVTLPLILLAAVALLLSFLAERETDPIRAYTYYPAALEYIVASITISFGGMLLAEVADRDSKR